jgi:hypothetical protein
MSLMVADFQSCQVLRSVSMLLIFYVVKCVLLLQLETEMFIMLANKYKQELRFCSIIFRALIQNKRRDVVL